MSDVIGPPEAEEVVVRYGVKELLALQGKTLERIESKVEAGNQAQAETNAKVDLRLAMIEALNLSPRLERLEKFRNAVPSAAFLSLIVSGTLAAHYLLH